MDERRQVFLNTYEIKEQIGEGSGGTVIKAYHRNLQKDVVLKKMHEDAAKVLNKRSETDALKNLRHQYIPQVLDFVELEDGIYTVMDYIPGTSFKKLMDNGRRFSQKEALKYARQLFEALTYIHSQNPKIIHGDIKPDNLMLTPDDNICLIDFNISGFAGENGAVIDGYSGCYASPEQVAGFQSNMAARRNSRIVGNKIRNQNADDDRTELLDATEFEKTELENNQADDATEIINDNSSSAVDFFAIDERADIYSAAATIYHILTGVQPKRVNGKVAPANLVSKKVTEAFSYILEHAMEKEPENRFQSAADVLKALNGIHKLDKRYKALVRQQNILFVFSILLICVGIALFVSGQNLKKVEQVTGYDNNIEEMIAIAVSVLPGDDSQDERFSVLYDECLSNNPRLVGAYLSKAVYLYNKREYEDVIDYLEKSVIEKNDITNQSGGETIYYIYGSSYLHSDYADYDTAITALRKAIDMGDIQPGCYRELAEAYIAKGDLNGAESTLAEAKANGVSGADIDLMNGEIYMAQKDYTEAERAYWECVSSAQLTGDNDVLLRAYLGLNETIRALDQSENGIKSAIDILDEALKSLPTGYQIQIMQSQVQNYIDAYQLTEDNSYAQNGIDLLQESIDNGWKDFSNYINLAFLYEQCKDYDNAREVLQSLITEYPDNYVSYKRMAYLEADIQKSLDVSKRDYTLFATYYETAVSKYEQSSNAGGDLEIEFLKQMYQEVKDGGWIK